MYLIQYHACFHWLAIIHASASYIPASSLISMVSSEKVTLDGVSLRTGMLGCEGGGVALGEATEEAGSRAVTGW